MSKPLREPPSVDPAAALSAAPAAAAQNERGLQHWVVVFCVFGITGGLTVRLSALVLQDLLGLQGSFWAGPWSFRVAYLLLISPCYSLLLATIGTLLGKGPYFRSRVVRMWRRLVPAFVVRRWSGRV